MKEEIPHITGSIVLYKSNPEFIKDVIKDFFESAPSPRRLFLIDNSPTEELQSLSLLYPDETCYYHSLRNVGYGSAHNIAISKALALKSRYHVIINPDVRFEPEVLPRLAEFMDASPDVGLVMPQVFFPDGSAQNLCKLLPRPWDVFVRKFVPSAKLREYNNKRYEMQGLEGLQEAVDVPSLSGCFMFIRTEVLRKVKGFDERFFMYVEDIDLCRRIGVESRTVCLPQLSISHAFSRGSYHDAKLLKHHIVSMVRYFNKWGWFSDPYRKRLNAKCLQQLELLKQKGR